jgi:ribonucleoside-diphosphate reductase alpha chain
MQRAAEAFMTMRMGGGIGYDFSQLRPKGAAIRSAIGAVSSGPMSFMDIYDAICSTVAAAGNRRGAQMGVLRVDHPDIEDFISVKQDLTRLRNFNLSVGITDSFMNVVESGGDFDLTFGDTVHRQVDARNLWDSIMRGTWDYAEPGVIFLDTINSWNNLWYCETISATNPCAEQPLPPYGACLLSSMNITKYVRRRQGQNIIDLEGLAADVYPTVRALDNVIDQAIYPLEEQSKEAKAKRRMGGGVTGMANALEACGFEYGSGDYIDMQERVMKRIRDASYHASCLLAQEKGAFPLYDKEQYMQGRFIDTLPDYIRDMIAQHGIRNSHLLSIAPTGTISLSADNISSGIEPVFQSEYDRTISTTDGDKVERVHDYGKQVFGVEGKPASDLSPEEHVDVLLSAQKYVDSAVSKTCNVGDDVDWGRFKNIYMRAWKGGAKGCTTFRAAGKRAGILTEIDDVEEGAACFLDPDTGTKSCE